MLLANPARKDIPILLICFGGNLIAARILSSVRGHSSPELVTVLSEWVVQDFDARD